MGAEDVRLALTAALASVLPARLAEVEARLGLDAGTLAMPTLIGATDVRLIPPESWPALMVVVTTAGGRRLVEVLPEGNVYEAAYTVRLMPLVRADGFEVTGTLRDRYDAAVTHAVLAHQVLAGGRMGGSVVNRYSDVVRDEDAGATVAASFVEFDLVVAETVTVPTLGEVETVEVEAAALPPIHPALA